MKNLEELKKALAALKGEVHERYGVSKIEVFGSYVRGEQREDSDLDYWWSLTGRWIYWRFPA